jgi:hypothetical protein
LVRGERGAEEERERESGKEYRNESASSASFHSSSTLSFWVREERGTEEERESDKKYTEISRHLLLLLIPLELCPSG